MEHSRRNALFENGGAIRLRRKLKARTLSTTRSDLTMVHNIDVVLKRFVRPDEVRTFEKGKFEVVRIGGISIGRATYEPGWKWSLHVGSRTGATRCPVEHVGIVVSGCATAEMDDGTVTEMLPGDIFYIPPGHDSWVVGTHPCVSLHLLGADEYAKNH
jgi:quercetin dioxygenase-like cupin family protein